MTDKKRYKILVIEDNPGDFTLVEDFLFEQIESPAITNVETFKEAKDILLSKENKFDIVLLDLSLPDKKGEPLILEIIAICPNIPVIVLTGYADFTFGIKSLSLGIADYILKEELTSISLYKSITYSTERKKGISALEESEKRYSELFHLSPIPMWVIDLDTLYYLDANDAAIKNYGYSFDEFLSMTIKDIRPLEEIPLLEEAMKKQTTSQQFGFLGIYVHQKKNGDIIQVEIQSNDIQYKGKKARIILANDITERLNYIKTIEKQNEKFREIAWMQSHVIRAPLARIMGLIPFIMDLENNDIERKEFIGYLSYSANELDDVINKITNITYEIQANETHGLITL